MDYAPTRRSSLLWSAQASTNRPTRLLGSLDSTRLGTCCPAANIPPYAVGPALLIVGSLMVANVAKIPWDRIGQAIPAFITLALMPLTYSIAYGAPPCRHLQRCGLLSIHVLRPGVASWPFRIIMHALSPNMRCVTQHGGRHWNGRRRQPRPVHLRAP